MKKSTSATGKKTTVWTDEERAAMQERARELKAEARGKKNRAAGEADVLARIAEMPDPDRTMAERIHTVVTAAAPDLMPRTWYGMPAYADAAGKVVCFFTAASKFNERYATFGFQPVANLDDGSMWPTSFALTKLTKAEETRIGELVRRAVG